MKFNIRLINMEQTKIVMGINCNDGGLSYPLLLRINALNSDYQKSGCGFFVEDYRVGFTVRLYGTIGFGIWVKGIFLFQKFLQPFQ